MQINDRRIVEPYTVKRPAYPLAGDKSGGGLNALAFTCKTVLIAVSRYAPCSVAAHFAEASVGVVKQQTIVSVSSLSRSNEHKPVCADACPAAAQRARKAGSGRKRNILFNSIYHNKVVAGSVHFRKPHIYPP